MKNINNINNNNNNNTSGGKIIGTGGFGCVFKPALLCEGSTKREPNKISKLMTIKRGEEEYNELLNIKDKLHEIKDYKQFFLVDDLTLCKPKSLTKNDISNFKKCEALQKEDINANNINNSLDKLRILNIPYGGVTVDHFIMHNKNYKKLIEMNSKLIKLLMNGITPMNKKNVYHSDIKDTNILIDDSTKAMYIRLIDWSLTVDYIPFKNNKFPHNWKNRPLQFNVPFSVILFTDLFVDSYSKYLNSDKTATITKKKELLSEESLQRFVENYLQLWMKERGPGHYKYINKIMYMLFYNNIKTNKLGKRSDKYVKIYIENNYTLPYIINYLVKILTHYTSFDNDNKHSGNYLEGKLNIRGYLDNVFINIIDIWGFVISYLPLYELLFLNYNNLTANQVTLFNKLNLLFLKYLYTPRIEKINIENLAHDLKEFNVIIENKYIN
jgi:hypothetical protein